MGNLYDKFADVDVLNYHHTMHDWFQYMKYNSTGILYYISKGKTLGFMWSASPCCKRVWFIEQADSTYIKTNAPESNTKCFVISVIEKKYKIAKYNI